MHTRGDLTHAMGPTVDLAPLLVELGAGVPGRGFYIVAGKMEHLDELVEQGATEYAANPSRLAHVAAVTRHARAARIVQCDDGLHHLPSCL
ncbi:hypothetical protein [Microbacterium sp. 18062]|uniref:hypothetical protein n=1 Tax=Microbacterium sp. 18062 TaxID=2681410 RepID=UPI00190FB0BE|nr:hypothetical protein [Microbacterium sp. 18062]